MQKCPVCSSSLIPPFLVRGSVPVHQNLVMADRISAREINRGNLTLAVCEDCGFIFNQDFDGSKLSYGKEYDNTQTYSPSFESYISELARSLIYEKNVQNCLILSVTCGGLT